ncbi:hypothetical protein CPB86DRAFT_778285 [Serendipita vermifera]|nr:hypothetical protein CPB86DRAFT_778285 [Serendipita vermifera]
MEDSPHVNQPTENQELHEKTLKLLRREWKWAAASDFLYKFNPMLRLDFLDLAVCTSIPFTLAFCLPLLGYSVSYSTAMPDHSSAVSC